MQFHPIFKKSIPKGLTPTQKQVFLELSEKGYSLFCNEGADYKCWIEKNNKVIRQVDRRTANALSNKGIIVLDDSFKSDSKFKMKLA